MSTNKLVRLPLAEQWAERICGQVGKSVESIIECGRLLLKAKDDLAHGEWGRLFNDRLIPFSPNTAQRLMAVASHPQLSNTAHVPHLPPSWGTLYELTKVEPQRLQAAFKDHLITPDMERRDVRALMLTTSGDMPRHTTSFDAQATDIADRAAVPSESSTGEKPPREAARRPLAPPSNGVQFARIAIMKLEEIRENDTERQHAFAMVRSWLDARET